MKLLPAAVVGICACFTVSTAVAAVKIGEPSPDFSLTDIAGRSHQLSAYRGKIVILEWVNSGCPFVQKHYESGNIPKLQRSAREQDIVWLTINSAHPGAQGDSGESEAAQWLSSHDAAPAAYLRDQTGKVGRLYGAKTTPHLFIINREGVLVYNGAIDDIRSANKADLVRARNLVAAALEDLKAGRAVGTPTSQPYGCAVKY